MPEVGVVGGGVGGVEVVNGDKPPVIRWVSSRNLIMYSVATIVSNTVLYT